MPKYDPPRCKNCGERHALGTWCPVLNRKPQAPTLVTNHVTPHTPVTQNVTSVPLVTGNVTVGGELGAHICSVCGLPHEVAKTAAERAAAYRKRKTES